MPRFRFDHVHFVAAAVLIAMTGFAAADPAAAQPTPQVTSEIACTSDADCPPGVGACRVPVPPPGLPGCGCDEAAGRCFPVPAPCGACFGREICSAQNVCVEPGPGPGAPCNRHQDCADWLLCDAGGKCARGACAIAADCKAGMDCVHGECVDSGCSDSSPCPAGLTCRDGECVPPCTSDSQCKSKQVCRAGVCMPVECRSAADCRGCELCTSENACFSLCRGTEECLNVNLNLSTRLPQFACVDRSRLRCDRGGKCPVGETCVAGTCGTMREASCGQGGTSCPPGQLCVRDKCRSLGLP